MNISTIGRRIKARLKELKATQGWLAGELGLSDVAISKWISGESDPTFSNLQAMAKILDCSVGYLAGDIEDDDVAAITEIARHMSPEAKKFYRSSGSAIVEPVSSQANKRTRSGEKT